VVVVHEALTAALHKLRDQLGADMILRGQKVRILQKTVKCLPLDIGEGDWRVLWAQ